MLERFLCTLRRADFMPFPAKPSLLGCKGMEARGKGVWYPHTGPKSNQVLRHFSPFLLKISCCCVPILSHLMLTSTSANIMPVGLLLGTMDFWHTCSCFKYTCIRLIALPTPDYPNLHLKVRENEMAGEGSSFLQIYSLSFAQLLINLSCL